MVMLVKEVCRICLGEEVEGMVSSRCLCKGSLGHIHLTCQDRWQLVTGHRRCEICSYPIRHPSQSAPAWCLFWLWYHTARLIIKSFRLAANALSFTACFLATVFLFHLAEMQLSESRDYTRWFLQVTSKLWKAILNPYCIIADDSIK